jgi:hypothetical protein
MAQIVACEACGKPVSTEAGACPNCGHPPRKSKEEPTWLKMLLGFRRGFRVLMLVGFVIFVAWISLRIFVVSQEREYAANGMPKCTSSTAESDVQRAWENSPTRRILGLSIIKFEDPEAVSETATEHECRAVVTLNNTQRHPLSYKFKKDSGDKYLIEVRVEGL